MKTVSAALAAHLASPSTTVALLWKLKQVDGTTLGFTDHDQPITFNDGVDTVAYTPTEGITGSATESSSTDIGNQEIVGFLESDGITETDIFAGRYNYATVEIRLVNWADLTMGALLWKKCTLGEVKIKNGQFTAELRGLEFWLSTNLGEVYSSGCTADLFDAQCTLNRADFVQGGTVEAAIDRQTFVPGSLWIPGASTEPAPAQYFVNGVVTWTSGANEGLAMEIATWDGTTIELFENMPFDIQPDDKFDIEPGCDKTIATCDTKFDNVDNHRGFPNIPGMDQITIYPNAGGAVPS